jgi:hypothetical protein
MNKMKTNYQAIVFPDNKVILVTDELISENEYFFWDNSVLKCKYVLGQKEEHQSIYCVQDREHFSFDCKKAIASNYYSLLPKLDYSLVDIGVIDVDKLTDMYRVEVGEINNHEAALIRWLVGLEIIKKRKFTFEDVIQALKVGYTASYEHSRMGNNPMNSCVENYVQCLSKPTVFDVEIEMEEVFDEFEAQPLFTGKYQPKITDNTIKILKLL